MTHIIRCVTLGAPIVLAACGGTLATENTNPTAPEAAASTVVPAAPAVRDLTWSGIDYDARRVAKERFLTPVRLCWENVAAGAPTTAGIARFDLAIDHEGYVVDRSVHVMLFREHFLGDNDADAEAAFSSCVLDQFNRLPVPPATAARGSLSFDVRLLPTIGP